MVQVFLYHDYNIPSNNRELQQNCIYRYTHLHYNIPSNNRELQLEQNVKFLS